MKKRLLAILLAALMIVSLLPTTVFAGEATDCTYPQKVTAPVSGETYQLKLGGKDAGEFIFAQVEGGWSIQQTGEDGKYLAMQDGKLVLSEEAFAWTYKNNAFSASIKTEQKNTGFWFGFIYIPSFGGTRTVTTTYYLSTVKENEKLSTCLTCVELYTEVMGTHDYKYVNKGNGTHDKVCKNCNDTVNEPCDYDEITHKCVCGAYDPAQSSVKISVVDVKTKTTKQFSGFLFWGTWKDVTTYTATIKTEATGVKITKVQYQLNGGSKWTTGTSVSSNKPIETLTIKAWDSNGNPYEYEWPEAPAPTGYTVTFDMQGYGTAPESQSVEKGGKVTKPTEPTAAGFTFVDWYKEAECTNAWNFDTDTVDAATTLYAKWTAKDVAIEEAVANGTNIKADDENVAVTSGDGKTPETLTTTQAEKLAVKINTLLESASVADFSDNGLKESTKIEETTGLNAIIAALKNVAPDDTAKGNLDGKTSADVDLQIKVVLSAVNVKTSDDLTVTSMEFDVTPIATTTVKDENGKTVSVTADITSTLTTDVTFRLPVDSSLNVPGNTIAVYHAGEFLGNYEIKDDAPNTYIEIKSKDFSKYSYELLNESNAGAKIDSTLYFKFADAVAKVENNQTITLLKPATGTATATIARAVTFTVDKNEKNFNATVSAGEGFALTGTDPTQATITYTCFPDNTQFTVTFDLNGITGTAPDPQTVAYGTTVSKPTDPTFEGHTFGGWYKTKDDTTGLLSDQWNFDTDTVLGATTLYAKWTISVDQLLPESFPTSENQATVPDDAWATEDGQKCYLYSDFLVFAPTGGTNEAYSLDSRVAQKSGDNYVYVDGDVTIIFSMTSGELTGITISGTEEGNCDGTYTTSAAPVTYMDWDADTKKLVEKSTTEAIEVTKDTTSLEGGKFYVVKGADVQTGTLTVNGTTDNPTTLILADGSKLTVSGGEDKAGINVASDKALVITGTGVLVANGGQNGAGIGGGEEAGGGTVTINGGIVTANGGDLGAGIGGGDLGAGGTVTINGGIVTATAGEEAEAIGAGYGGDPHGDLTFGEGVNFIINAGNDAASAQPKTAEDFAYNHSAAYVSIAKASIKYMDWDDSNKKLVEKSIPAEDAIEVTNATTTLEEGKTYIVKGADVKTGTLTVGGTSEKPTTLILMDGAKLSPKGGMNEAGINVASDKALIITTPKDGTGILEAKGGLSGAGIGGSNAAGGAVTINGGTVTATGGLDGAGIGGANGAGGAVTINGGEVTAKGGGSAAGIGGGNNGAGGTVTINGGTVTATGGQFGAGIGGGKSGSHGTLTFGEGVNFAVMAGANEAGATDTDASEYALDHSAAYVSIAVDNSVKFMKWNDVNKKLVEDKTSDYIEIKDNTTTTLDAGKFYVVKGEDVKINSTLTVSGTTDNPTTLILMDGAQLTVTGSNSAGINVASDKAVVITGQTNGTGVLIATGGELGAGIGGDYGETGGNITINGGNITATGGNNAVGSGAGIGAGADSKGGIVTINGGTITATGGNKAAGISGGSYGNGGTVTINGGTITATGKAGAAGIGGGLNGGGGAVTINGGNITATGEDGAAGIGPGSSGSTFGNGTVTFGEGVNFAVMAGANEAGATDTDAATYSGSHSAAYVSIEESAAPTFKAVYNTKDSANTLTFYYDNKDHSGENITVYENGTDNYLFDDSKSDGKKWGYNGIRTNVKSVVIDSSVAKYKGLTSTSYMFYNMSNAENISGAENLNVSNVTSMYYMFRRFACNSTTPNAVPNVSNWNTENVTDMTSMFYEYGCNSTTLTAVPDVSKWNTAKVTTMKGMFSSYGYTSGALTAVPNVSNWNTGNVTDMSLMFYEYGWKSTALNAVPNVSNWNTENVTDMSNMFREYGYTSAVLTAVPDVSKWNTASVTDVECLFSDYGYNSTVLEFTLDLSGWNVGSLTSYSGMFSALNSAKTWSVTIPAKTGSTDNTMYKWFVGDGTNTNNCIWRATNREFTLAGSEPTTFTVTFDLNGATGTAPDQQTVANGGKVTALEDDPKFAKHYFNGWYKTKDDTTGLLSDPWDFTNDTVTADMTLYAQWTRTVSSILGTNSGFPTSNNATAPANAWINSSDPTLKIFKANNGICITDIDIPGSGFSHASYIEFVLVGNDYVGDVEGYGKITCHMTEGKFTSAQYDGTGTDYAGLSGTYVAPITYMDWDDANKKLVEKSTTEAIEVTDTTTSLVGGKFYVVKGTDVQTGTLTVTGTGAATLILADGAKLTATGASNKAGINVAYGNALVITGQSGSTGELSATGGNGGAGIGGAYNENGGTVTINGGTVTATGDGKGAGIGGGCNGAGGTVTINGGTVTATGHNEAAGIGGGSLRDGGNVTINGGTVNAYGGAGGAGIGGASGKNGGTVIINGGTVTATGDYGAGIGGGTGGNGGNVTINGGAVTATTTADEEGAAIGNGYYGDGAGTLTFGAGVNFSVKAGAAAPGTETDASTYASNHSAKYVSITSIFTVTFDLDGVTGVAPTAQTIAYGGTVAKPDDPEFTELMFAGWFRTKDPITGELSDEWYFEDIPDYCTADVVTENMTLYAGWRRQVGSILNTVSGFPSSTTFSAASGAWVSGDCKCNIANNGQNLQFFKGSVSYTGFNLLEYTTKFKSKYVYYFKNGDTVTFNMTGDVLTSITFYAESGLYANLNGTYTPAN